ncbi:hypothetical protein HIM_11959 [Hirsutella minnesotensis 3608]|uniref:Ig-like domain-containing protein n=1 Tax=Hirsutella minnesotensis 3608 TaxID=1043627 RepID=A0A0F7ZQY1_9HYPO|nr:hypothetical protein HIM_11959 [Hirsutella minnesotensis 3608]
MSHTSGRPPYYGVHLGAVLLAVAVLLCSRLQGVSAADRPTDRDISALDRVCVPPGIPYLTIGCRTGNQHTHYSVCEVDGVVRYGDVAGREVTAYGLMHNCAPTHVRAPGRGYAQVAGWKPGPVGSTSATEPGGRIYACAYENSDSLATGGELKERPRPASALSSAPWGVRDSVGRSREYWLNETHSARDYHKGGTADQWSGRSYCDSAGLATLVYLCDFGRGDELLHFCNDHERGWWYDLFGNQMAVDVAWCACRAVGIIRVPPAPYPPESSGRGLPKRRVVPAADYSPSRVEPGRLSFGYGPQTAWDNYSPHRARGIAWNLHQSGERDPLPMSATDLSDAGRNLTKGICTRSGEGYVVWRCHQGRGRHYVVTCGTGADTTLDGSAGGTGEGLGVTRGCSPVNVGAPNRGPQVGPASPWVNTFHWNNYPAGYNAECAPLRRDPGATGRRARSPTRAEVAALAIPPWGWVPARTIRLANSRRHVRRSDGLTAGPGARTVTGGVCRPPFTCATPAGSNCSTSATTANVGGGMTYSGTSLPITASGASATYWV